MVGGPEPGSQLGPVVGGPTVAQGSASPNLLIPSQNEVGIRNGITLDGCGTASVVRVSVDITHPWACDLEMVLRAPNGAVANLLPTEPDCAPG